MAEKTEGAGTLSAVWGARQRDVGWVLPSLSATDAGPSKGENEDLKISDEAYVYIEDLIEPSQSVGGCIVPPYDLEGLHDEPEPITLFTLNYDQTTHHANQDQKTFQIGDR